MRTYTQEATARTGPRYEIQAIYRPKIVRIRSKEGRDGHTHALPATPLLIPLPGQTTAKTPGLAAGSLDYRKRRWTTPLDRFPKRDHSTSKQEECQFREGRRWKDLVNARAVRYIACPSVLRDHSRCGVTEFLGPGGGCCLSCRSSYRITRSPQVLCPPGVSECRSRDETNVHCDAEAQHPVARHGRSHKFVARARRNTHISRHPAHH